MPTQPSTLVFNFVDDRAILSSNPNPVLVSSNLQEQLNFIKPMEN